MNGGSTTTRIVPGGDSFHPVYTVVMTGSRVWDDAAAIRSVIERLYGEHEDLVVHVGDARGADAIVRNVCGELGITVVVHVADWKKRGRAAGPVRNRKMLDAAKPELVVAFPIGASVGTRDCMEAAAARGITVFDVGNKGDVLL